MTNTVVTSKSYLIFILDTHPDYEIETLHDTINNQYILCFWKDTGKAFRVTLNPEMWKFFCKRARK